MKHLLSLFIVVILSHDCYSQGSKLSHYLATNGIDYRKGDTIKLGRGSNYDGTFKYILAYGFGSVMSGNAGNKLHSSYSGFSAIIRQVKELNNRGENKPFFIVDIEGSGYVLEIEDAIATCEIKQCLKKNDNATISVADELTKLKKLKDEGALSDEEYKAAKEKLLNK